MSSHNDYKAKSFHHWLASHHSSGGHGDTVLPWVRTNLYQPCCGEGRGGAFGFLDTRRRQQLLHDWETVGTGKPRDGVGAKCLYQWFINRKGRFYKDVCWLKLRHIFYLFFIFDPYPQTNWSLWSMTQRFKNRIWKKLREPWTQWEAIWERE